MHLETEGDGEGDHVGGFPIEGSGELPKGVASPSLTGSFFTLSFLFSRNRANEAFLAWGSSTLVVDGCRRFENTIPGNTELGGPEAEVVRACGAGGPGVERGTVVGAENVRPEATLPAWGGSIKFEDHVLSLPAKSMIA